ncbi:MAG TPA: zf-HC2 domain-containing protein [Acidimicrobiales bacterium]|nr:zf-HC2 domain-containing protein [Acidimicrobiales bacterium]
MADHVIPHPDLAGYVLGVLDAAETAAFEAHLDDCDDCRAEVVELRPLTAALDQAAPAADLPPGLAARTFTAVERAAAAESLHAGTTTAYAASRPGAPTTSRPSGRRRPRLLAAGAAVAALAALVAGLLLVWPASGSGSRPTAHVTLVSDVAGRTGTVGLRRTASGIVIDLAVAGLPPSGDGDHYECWYLSATDTPAAPDRVSAGTFTVGADGRAEVRMITAADPAEYPRIVVARQPGGGDPAVMGDTVLWSQWSPAGTTTR